MIRRRLGVEIVSLFTQPQTNGVVERFNKTLKEQIVYGRTYRNIEELRLAASEFMERYNQHWLLDKLGFRSPKQALSDFYNEKLKAVA
jgi:putative transposase